MDIHREIKLGKKENPNRKQALLVPGASLLIITANENIKQNFVDAATECEVVLACRVSPAQKAEIVSLVKDRFSDKTTLSIGDGANDVPMIMKAHIGVGILGKEGQQAARSADFAIGQFKHLKPLLFVHGREAYRRNSLVLLYSFYKNVVLVMMQYLFAFNSDYTGQVLIEPVFFELYNMTMTSFPIIIFAIFDFQYEKIRPANQPGNDKKYLMEHH